MPIKCANGRRSTITTVAKHAGVSIATVSQVLNRKPVRVTEATRRKVLEAAEILDYQPDPRYRLMGRHRRAQRPTTGQLGLLLPAGFRATFVGDAYHTQLFWAMEQESRQRRHHLTIGAIGDDEHLPLFVQDRQVDGVLFSGDVRRQVVQRIAQVVPMVSVNKIPDESLGIPSIMPDDAGTVRQSLEHLRSLGHERICYFDINDTNPPNMHHRRRAEAFARLTADLNQARLVIRNSRQASLRQVAQAHLSQWRDQHAMPTALFCAADIYAVAFLEAAEDLGIDVPGQLSVIGVDDIEWCEHTRPALTSIRQPLAAMGRAAVRMLLERIEQGEQAEPATMQQFPVQLIERASTAPAILTSVDRRRRVRGESA